MTGVVLYSIALAGLLASFIKDKKKTRQALIKAWKSFSNILPQVFTMMFIIGISLSLLDPTTISRLIGAESGLLGIAISLIIGSITMIPPFIGFPLGASLLQGGAGYPQVAALVSTLIAVGVITLPVEMKYFTREMAITRNLLFFLACVLFTLIIGQVM